MSSSFFRHPATTVSPLKGAHIEGDVRDINTETDIAVAKQAGGLPEAGYVRDPESHVLVLYTGGTIGMKSVDGVYIPVANYLPVAISELGHINDDVYQRKYYSHMKFPPCILPEISGNKKRICYWLLEYEPLLDSSNMSFSDWIRIAEDIHRNYDNYDGFLVLHGTDTLCYTASALSFILENLGKPVVITGAQIPICEVRSDGRENLIGALIVAGHFDIPEVKAFLQDPIRGIVLQTYGAGNVPSNRQDLIDELKKATDRGVIIVNTSQCPKGAVSGHYHTGAVLYEAGVISGADMTTEAALTKLAYVLGREDWDYAKRCKIMCKNIRGEQTVMGTSERREIDTETHVLGHSDVIRAFAKFLRVSSSEEVELLRSVLVPPMLCQAAGSGDLELLKQINSGMGGNLCSSDYDLRCPLHVAASAGKANVVRFLLENGASVHARDRWQASPLRCAVENSHLECIKLLRDAGGEIRMPQVALGMELCMCASLADDQKLRAWFEAGVDLNATDYDGRTALHIAASRGHVSTVHLLVELGAKSTNDTFNQMPVDEARKRGFGEIEKFLLAQFGSPII